MNEPLLNACESDQEILRAREIKREEILPLHIKYSKMEIGKKFESEKIFHYRIRLKLKKVL